jgi:trigger factor
MRAVKVVVNEINTCKRGLEVEVPGQLVHEELERALRDYSHRARLPGFRPGHIPLDLVRQRFGKEVREEVVNRMVREYAVRALEDKKLQPVHDPVLDEVRYESGQPLVFKATFEVRPPISVSDYHSIPVTMKHHVVSDEMVEASVRGFAERAAKLEAVTGRPVQKGDYVVGTLSCTFVSGKGKNLSNEPMLLEAGAETNHPDFNAALLGLEAGASRSFETKYPDDYNAEALRGRTVAYTLAVKEIKKKVLPEINDELARELGNFQTLAELREKVRSELERRSQEAEKTEARDAILATLVARYPIDVPDSMVEAQIDARLEGAVRDMMARGMDPTKAPVNWQEEREKIRPGAIDAVRAMLLLEAIAVQEGIEAGEDDVNNWLRDEARRHNVSISALKDQLAENARQAGLRRQIVREKSLDFLLNDATITHEGK